MGDTNAQDFRGHSYGQQYVLRAFEEVFEMDGVNLTFDFAAANQIPANAEPQRGYARITETIAGGGVTAASFGDAVDPNRWGDAAGLAALPANDMVTATALPPVIVAVPYVPRLTLDAAATDGTVVCTVWAWVPVVHG